MADWQDWVGKLEGAGEAEIDDVVDELAARLLALPPDPTAAPAAIKALALARSDLSVRSVAAALAYVAPDDNVEAVERLEQAFEARRQHAFLAPSLLGSLTLLGLRNESAVRVPSDTCSGSSRVSPVRSLWLGSRRSAFSATEITTRSCGPGCSRWSAPKTSPSGPRRGSRSP